LAGQYSHNSTTERGVCTHELISRTSSSPAASDSDAAPQDEHAVRKFPRTPHLFHSRGATSDDIVLGSGEVDKFLRTEVIVQEKVDGANLGFSLTADYEVDNDGRLHMSVAFGR
jgi:atypical dual specificity phosphatase